jgi:UDP-glucose 4-epimerase
MHKLMAEQMVEFSAQQFGIPSAIVRLFSIYGCGQRKQLLWDACRKLSAGDNVFMGTGEEVRDWIHVEDAAELMMLAAGHASSQSPIVNGGSGDGVTVREVVEQLSRSLLSKEPAVRFSGAPRAGDPARFVADIQRATSWGWRPVHDWKTGMAEYVAWWSRGAE